MKRIQVPMSKALAAVITKAAKRAGITPAQFIRVAIAEGLPKIEALAARARAGKGGVR